MDMLKGINVEAMSTESFAKYLWALDTNVAKRPNNRVFRYLTMVTMKTAFIRRYSDSLLEEINNITSYNELLEVINELDISAELEANLARADAEAEAEHSLYVYMHIEDEEDRKTHNLKVRDAYLADKSLPIEVYGLKTCTWHPINSPWFEDTAMRDITHRVRK